VKLECSRWLESSCSKHRRLARLVGFSDLLALCTCEVTCSATSIFCGVIFLPCRIFGHLVWLDRFPGQCAGSLQLCVIRIIQHSPSHIGRYPLIWTGNCVGKLSLFPASTACSQVCLLLSWQKGPSYVIASSPAVCVCGPTCATKRAEYITTMTSLPWDACIGFTRRSSLRINLIAMRFKLSGTWH
jgi:hypothetical protein